TQSPARDSQFQHQMTENTPLPASDRTNKRKNRTTHPKQHPQPNTRTKPPQKPTRPKQAETPTQKPTTPTKTPPTQPTKHKPHSGNMIREFKKTMTPKKSSPVDAPNW
ncbi:hypothetical protein RA262_27910, partial [Pseudomonas syringae pv. tagetis]